jgi:hypothetical protein
MQSSNQILLVHLLGWLTVMPWLASPDAFSQARQASVKELAQASTAILVGKCDKVESFWDENRTRIFTQVKIRAEESLKGNPGSEVVITVPGGRVGNTLYEVSDMPVFAPGEEVLVFLWRHPTGKNLVTGALQGKLSIVEDKKTGKKLLRGVSLRLEDDKTLRKTSATQSSAPEKIFLEDFVREVKGYARE